jgi:hypothetical protein
VDILLKKAELSQERLTKKMKKKKLKVSKMAKLDE